MALSVFDLFKIGIGPSSSHTVGPMRAARQFALRLRERGLLERVARISVTLYGSLGATGKGHGSDKAILLGLSGHEPDTVDVDAIAGIVERIRTTHEAAAARRARASPFDERADLTFNHKDTLPLHSNGMRFVGLDAGRRRSSASGLTTRWAADSSSATNRRRRRHGKAHRARPHRAALPVSQRRRVAGAVRAGKDFHRRASCAAMSASGAATRRSTPGCCTSGMSCRPA